VDIAYLLAHDIGTSATKTSIVRVDGSILASEATPHATNSPRPDWAEQNPADWWDGVCRNTRALLDRTSGAGRRIAAIGVSGHMLGCIAVDRDGEVLRPAMIHSDMRARDECDEIARRVGARNLYEITGNILDPRSPLCELLWLKRNEASVYEKAARFLQSKDYVVGRMVGSFESTDFSDASHAQWIDIRTQAYAVDVFKELGLDVDKLPALHASTDLVGRLAQPAARAMGLPAGIPVIAGGGDGSCATVGAGAVHPGDTYCCIGTTAWIEWTAMEPFIDPHARLFNVIALDGKTCGVFGTVQSAGRSVDWAMALLGEEFDSFDQVLNAAPPGSDGLLFLPYLEGERSPIFDPAARGVFFGITPNHKRAHLLRAVVEGVSFALRSILDVMRESSSVTALRLIGGGGRSEAWQQILADVCDVNIQALSTQAVDATSLGAAIAAGVGTGIYASLSEGARSIRIEKERPPNKELRPLYDGLFGVYTSLYPQLKPVYARLQEQVRSASPLRDSSP